MAPPSSTLLPGKSHGRRSLVGCSPWGHWESDTTEQLHFHFSLSCIGEGNGNPLHCSCLENPRDGGAWWAAVYRVTQSQTRLKWLSSSSSLMKFVIVWACLEYSVKDLARFLGSDIRSICSLLWSKKYPARSHTWTGCNKNPDVFAPLLTTKKMS